MKIVPGVLAALLLASRAYAGEFPVDDDIQRALRVNDGELKLLAALPAKPVHHHHNAIIIDAESLDTGQVTLRQCHYHMDVFARVEVVFDAARVSDLRVLESDRIGRAWVEGASVQLEDVQADARLCIELRSRALWPVDGGYELRNGPYMRKFLDGYYPMRVTMDVSYPATTLRFVDTVPAVQTGFTVRSADDQIHINAQFEGRLVTVVRFAAH